VDTPIWTSLERASQLEELVERSYDTPCLIFKHSTKCFISEVALRRLESNWSFSNQQLTPYFVDAIAQRPISKKVCEVFEEHHETPQILLIDKGEVILEANNMDIHAEEIAEML
jgi:bacillithiol system protein YtxJ